MPNVQTLKFDLAKPLLLIKAEKGVLGCGYFNIETFNKTSEAAAIVTGVSTFGDMLKAKIVLVSEEAKKLGVSEGDTGESALEKMNSNQKIIL